MVLVSETLCPSFVRLADADSALLEEMVLIPSGEYLMGAEEGKGRPDEYPRHKVFLDTFYFDRFEVTGEDFEEYLSPWEFLHTLLNI